jgi:hypothetical protein
VLRNQKANYQRKSKCRCSTGGQIKRHIAVKVLQEKTNTLSFNQLVIQATHRLTEKILSGDCKGLLKDFYDKMEETTRITRSTDKGDRQPQQ